MEFNASSSPGGTRFRFTATGDTTPVCTRSDQEGCVDTDLQNTATHEAGHFLGLSHSPEPDATMYASAPIGETAKRTLADDDVAGLCELYPAGGPPTTCTPSGRIVVVPSSGSTSSGCATASPGAGLLAALGLGLRRRRR
jgi:MYXO-CTERM domain-containing protein